MHGTHHPALPPFRLPAPAPGAGSLVGAALASRWSKRLALLALLALTLWLGGLQLRTPAVISATAPADAFSAERAMSHLSVLATQSRAVGTPGHAAAQQYLIEQIRALGLEPQVQTTGSVVAEGGEGFRAGTVSNIYVRVPGTASTGVLAINAHYDSGDTGPGASDCGSCTVAALETLRATLAGPALKNDLLFVFADGEELFMMGSAAFTEGHPWAREIKIAVNYEAIGSGGPAFLYVTSRDNNWLVREFLKVAPDASAYSLIPTISNLYTAGRFDSDLGEYIQEGSQGLGFLYAARLTDYHTDRDSLATIDPGSIQQEGGYSLAIVRHFGNLDLTAMPRSGDRVFFNVLPGFVAHYAAGWVMPLAVLTTAAIIALTVLGLRRRELTGRGLAVGTAAALIGALGSALLAALVWAGVWLLNPEYQVAMVGHYQTTLLVSALAATTVGLVAALFTLLALRVRHTNLAAGVLLGSLPALWIASVTVPGMSYLVTWPVLFATLPLAWVLLARGRFAGEWPRAAVLAIAALPALLLLPATLYQMSGLAERFEGMLGAPLLGLTMLFVAPLAVLFVPHLYFLGGESASRWRRWAVPGGAVLTAVALFGWAGITSGFDTEHPRPDHIAYELNADTGEARWVSFDRRLDDFTREFFPAGTVRTAHQTVLQGSVAAFTASAPVAALPVPEVTVLSDTVNGEARTLRLRFASPRGLTEMSAVVNSPGTILAAAIDGRDLDLSEYAPARDGELNLIYANVSPGGWELALTVRSTEPVTVRLQDLTTGLPALPGVTLPVRPADTMPSPLHPRDPTVITRTVRF